MTALIKAGADTERMSGGMPLAHAAGKGSCSAIEALLDGGAILESAASLPLVRGDQHVTLGVAARPASSGGGQAPARPGVLDPNGPPGAGIEPPLCCAVTDPPSTTTRVTPSWAGPRPGSPRARTRTRAREDAQSPYSPLMQASRRLARLFANC